MTKYGDYILDVPENEMTESKRQGSVEITEEMLSAGVKAMSGYDPDFVTRSDLVQDIFSAMWEAFLVSLVTTPK